MHISLSVAVEYMLNPLPKQGITIRDKNQGVSLTYDLPVELTHEVSALKNRAIGDREQRATVLRRRDGADAEVGRGPGMCGSSKTSLRGLLFFRGARASALPWLNCEPLRKLPVVLLARKWRGTTSCAFSGRPAV